MWSSSYMCFCISAHVYDSVSSSSTFSPGVTDILHIQWRYAAYPLGNPGEEKFPVLSWRLSPHPVHKPESKPHRDKLTDAWPGNLILLLENSRSFPDAKVSFRDHAFILKYEIIPAEIKGDDWKNKCSITRDNNTAVSFSHFTRIIKLISQSQMHLSKTLQTLEARAEGNLKSCLLLQTVVQWCKIGCYSKVFCRIRATYLDTYILF